MSARTTSRSRLPALPGSAIACHEAAHAVVAEHMGRAVKLVTIVPADHYAGVMRTHPDQPKAPLGTEFDWCVKTATITAAGRAAEKHFGYRTRDVQMLPGDDDDAVRGLVAAMSLDKGEHALIERWIRFRAAAVVKALAPEIATVARALEARHTLTRDQLLPLLPSIGRSPVALRSFALVDVGAPASSSINPQAKANP